MNSSKRVKTLKVVKPEMDSNDMKIRDLYEDMICDDLSEVILQYLSLEDKLRLECVSQQFRRTLFAKHYSLKRIPNKAKLSLETIVKLVKKLPKLSEIYLYDNNINKFTKFNQKFIETIIKYCNNLTKIELNTKKYNQILSKEFIDKFGSTLVSLEINDYFVLDLQTITYWSQLSNIEELIVYRIPDLTDVHFNRLKRLEIHILNDENIETLKVLFEDNRNTLKHLKIRIFEFNDEFYETLFILISKLKNLIDLEFGPNLLLFDKEFDAYITQIALNCNHLKRLCFVYHINKINSFEDLLSSLKRFKSLKRLDLELYYYKPLNDEKIPETLLSTLLKCEAFRELTHLKLNFNFYIKCESNMDLTIDGNNVFKNIDNYLPKLQSLIIDGIDFNCDENTAHILSRPSDLKTIELSVTKKSVKHKIETKLKEKSKRITTINIDVMESSHFSESDESSESSDSENS